MKILLWPFSVVWWVLQGMPSETMRVDGLIRRAEDRRAKEVTEEMEQPNKPNEAFLAQVEAKELEMHGKISRSTKRLRARLESGNTNTGRRRTSRKKMGHRRKN